MKIKELKAISSYFLSTLPAFTKRRMFHAVGLINLPKRIYIEDSLKTFGQKENPICDKPF